MSKDETLLDNFVTVTKRLPLKARFVVGLCMVVVVFELISGVAELNDDNYSTGRLRNTRLHGVGKIRERKETNPDLSILESSSRHHSNDRNTRVEKFSQNASEDEVEEMVEVKNNVRLKYQKVQRLKNEIDQGIKQKKRNLTDTGRTNNTNLQPQVKISV